MLDDIKWMARPVLLGLVTVLLFLDKWHTGVLNLQLFGLVVTGWGCLFASREKDKANARKPLS